MVQKCVEIFLSCGVPSYLLQINIASFEGGRLWWGGQTLYLGAPPELMATMMTSKLQNSSNEQSKLKPNKKNDKIRQLRWGQNPIIMSLFCCDFVIVVLIVVALLKGLVVVNESLSDTH